MERRTFLKSLGISAAVLATGSPWGWRRADAAAPAGWRTFEVATTVDIQNPSGICRVWVPLPLMTDTDYQKRLGDSWTGNAAAMRLYRDETYDAGMLYAEWRDGEPAPWLEVVSRFATHDRSVDFSQPPAHGARESKGALDRYLAPTKLIPTDGIVRETSREITQGAKTDIEKARAIYEWIVENTFRDPKVRGCGLGDIRSMLETGNLGGKCADLNALFVGLARAAGIPARDVYGVRVADSAEFKSLGKSGDITTAQHCRAEFYTTEYGWIPVDPADVRKVVLEEKPALTLADTVAQRARATLFGHWEMNYLAYNYAHDVKLPNSGGAPLPFLMYTQCETAEGRRDSLDPRSVKYAMTSREVTG